MTWGFSDLFSGFRVQVQRSGNLSRLLWRMVRFGSGLVFNDRHGELITIFGAVVKPTLDELSALWLSCSWICDALAVRISQKSQENSQKRASTDTGIRRVQKEAKDSKPKPEKSSLSQIQSKVKEVKSIVFISSQAKEATSSMEEAQLVVGFCTKSFSKEAQVSLKRIATLAIRVRSLIDPTAKILAPMIG
ncbi:hypothetical protein Tco_0672851 [Tanacetum coccineum]